VIPVENEGNDIVPQFPLSPEGVARLKHLPTVEACIRYWEAIRLRAWRAGDDFLIQLATGLKESYEEARQELTKAEQSQERKTARTSRRARPPD